jgi:hypothetical protein
MQQCVKDILSAAKAARARLETMYDADEATKADIEVLADLITAINKVENTIKSATPEQIAAAKEMYQTDDVEIDDDATTSNIPDETGGSAWISAWVYVDGAELP